MRCYLWGDIIYLHAMKIFNCLYLYTEPLLKGEEVFLQACWQS